MNIVDITPAKKETAGKIRLAAYCRVSSDSEDQLNSFAAQVRYFKEYELHHPEYRLTDIYADAGITGTSMNKRDELQRLIRDCKAGKVDRVIVKSVSRLARNTQELLELLRLLKSIGVSVYFEEQGIDTDKLNAEMIVTFPGMAAQQESVSISENMRWSYRKRMESGDFNTTKPPFGYRLENAQLVIHEEEAEVIRSIFDMYLQGLGIQAIADELNRSTVIKPHEKDVWIWKTVRDILINERYKGDALLQKTFTTTTLPFRQKKNKGELPQYYVENSHPAIISAETFDAVQRLMNKRRRKTGPRVDRLLSGMLRCGSCGSAFRRMTTRGKEYYLCSCRASGRGDCGNIARLTEAGVCMAFSIMADKLSYYREPLLGTLIRQLETMQLRLKGFSEKTEAVDKEIAELASRKYILAKLHTDGIMNDAEYYAQSSELDQLIADRRAEKKNLLQEDETDSQLKEIHELDDIINEYAPDGIFDEQLFGTIVESITVRSSSELEFHLIGGITLPEQIPEKMRCKTS